MVLELTGMADKLITACVGHARKRFVIVQMPVMTDAGRETLYQLLYPDNTVIVRYLHAGTVVGFSAKIIKTIQIPFPLIFLTFPKRLESHDLRKHPRISCCIPGKLVTAKATFPGMILDLSTSGCQFSATSESGTPDVAVDDAATLHCDLFDPSEEHLAPSVVKRVSRCGQRLELGLKFHDLPYAIRRALNNYLHEAISVLG